MAGSQHPEFLGAGAQPGLEIWRIEKKIPVRVPEAQYGKFCKGDSYLVLKTIQTKGGSYEWDLHFWLGAESSVDEIGIAAYKTVELDDSLGGAPVQYRETQNNESPKFLSLFKEGITYMEGGVASGFRKVERDKYETRLFHCKGKRQVRANQVAVSHASLNSGDVFILDSGLKLYQWNGKDSNTYERAKAVDFAKRIRDMERGGRAEIMCVDEGGEGEDFWSGLGGKGRIMSAEEAGDDQEAEKKFSQDLRVVPVTMTSNSLEFGAPLRPVKQAMLDSSGLVLVDTGREIFAWVGKGADKSLRSAAISIATSYLERNNRPNSTSISRVAQGTETPTFKDCFPDWRDAAVRTAPALRDFSKPVSPSVSQIKQIDSAELASGMVSRAPALSPEQKRAKMMKEVTAFTFKTGKVEVWRIENFDMVPVEPNLYGQFYSGDSYVILHSYDDASGRQAWVIYFWLGRNSTQDEIGTAALKAKELDDQYGGAPVQVRVTQNKEPLHMLCLFDGKFVVHEGGNPSSFRNVRQKAKLSDGTGLYHISGSNEWNTRAVQVEQTARSLNSSDAFLLCERDRVIVWMGRKCNADERRTARATAQLISGGRQSSEVEEGNEPPDFWDKLGGKQEYPEGLPEEDEAAAPRLFQCSNATGVFKSEEIFDFAQDDLIMDDVFILDVSSEIFAWVGAEANETERRGIMDLCLAYLKAGGREGTVIIEVHAGAEPPNFTCHFLGWDRTKAKVFEDPYEAKMKKLKAENAPAVANPFGVVLKKEPGRAQRSAAPLPAAVPINQGPSSMAPTDASGSKIVVKLVSAEGLRTNARGKSPNPIVELIISQDGRTSGATFTSKIQPNTSGPVWNEEFVLPVKDPAKSKLECLIWDESGDGNLTLAQKFLGEVVLNLPKLIPYNKTVIEQVFDIKQGKTHQITAEDKKASGKLKLVLQLIILDHPDRPQSPLPTNSSPAEAARKSPLQPITPQAATPASAPVPKPKEESLPASLLPSMLRNTYDLAAPNKVDEVAARKTQHVQRSAPVPPAVNKLKPDNTLSERPSFSEQTQRVLVQTDVVRLLEGRLTKMQEEVKSNSDVIKLMEEKLRSAEAEIVRLQQEENRQRNRAEAAEALAIREREAAETAAAEAAAAVAAAAASLPTRSQNGMLEHAYIPRQTTSSSKEATPVHDPYQQFHSQQCPAKHGLPCECMVSATSIPAPVLHPVRAAPISIDDIEQRLKASKEWFSQETSFTRPAPVPFMSQASVRPGPLNAPQLQHPYRVSEFPSNAPMYISSDLGTLGRAGPTTQAQGYAGTRNPAAWNEMLT